MSVIHSARTGDIIGIVFFSFSNMKVIFCVFSSESPHRGESNENVQHTIINIKKKITQNYTKYNNVCSCGIILLGTQDRNRNSHGKRAISVRATEVLLYKVLYICNFDVTYHAF